VPPFDVVEPAMARILRTMTGAQRLEIAFSFYRSARTMLRSELTARHPGWTSEEVEAEVTRRLASGSG
jgi:hypothetical protein